MTSLGKTTSFAIADDPSISPSIGEMAEGGLSTGWTYAIVEDRLIEAVTMWWRSPAARFDLKAARASDGPWHLITLEWGDALAMIEGGHDLDAPLKPLPLAQAEVARMQEAGEWIGRYAPEADRALVCKVLRIKAGGRRPSWIALLHEMGLKRGAEGLRKRYSRAVTAIAQGLDKARVPVVMARI